MSLSFAGDNTDEGPDIGLTLPRYQIAKLFPFHAVLNQKLQLVHMGPSLRKLFPALRLGMSLEKEWVLERPLMPFRFENVASQTETLFLIRAGRGVRLRGQMIPLANGRRIVFLCSPWLSESSGLAAMGLGFEDFPLHDSMPEFLNLVQTQRLGIEDLRKLTGKLREQREVLRAANEKEAERSAESRKLALIAARTDNGVIVTDAHGIAEWVNEGFTRITGYSAEEIRGKTPGKLLQGPETDPEVVAFMNSRIRQQQGFSSEVVNYRKDGTKYWIHIEVQPIHDEEDRLIHFMGIERDITARKAEESRRDLELSISTILADSSDASQVLNRIVQAIVESVGCQFSAIWKLDKKTDTLHASLVWAVPVLENSQFEAETNSRTLARGEGLPGTVVDTNGPYSITDLSQADHFVRKNSALSSGLQSGFGFPIRIGGEPWGVMEFYTMRRKDKDEELLKTLASLGTQIGQFVERQDQEAERGRLMSLLNSTLESTGDGILVVDNSGKYVVWNQNFLRIWGFDAELARNAAPGELLQREVAQVANPEEYTQSVKWLKNHPAESGEDVVHLRDGRVFDMTSQPQIVGGAVIGRIWSYREFTDRWRAAKRVRESEEQYRVIAATASDGILTIDARNRILFANRAAERIFGYIPGTMSDKSVQDIVPSKYRNLGFSELLQAIRNARSGDAPKLAQAEGLRADGSEFPLELTFGKSRLRGQRALTVVIRDITERRATEEKLKTAIETLKLATVAAETANQAKSDFLASISHEIRTPLNSIVGLTELLRATKLDKDQQDMIETVWTGSASLLHLINDLLDFSKIEAGQVDIVTGEFDPMEICRRSLDIVRPKAQSKGLALVCFSNSLPLPHVEGDANRVGQILVNLLNNGVKFTESGYVATQVEWQADGDGRAVLEFNVTDTGIGIDEKDRNRVFEKFQRADTPVGRRAGGTGLGLSISRLLAEAMGGTLELLPKKQSGSHFRFKVSLPLKAGLPAYEGQISATGHLIASSPRKEILAQAWSSIGLAIVPLSSPCDIVLCEEGETAIHESKEPVLVIGDPKRARRDHDKHRIDFPLTPFKMKSALANALEVNMPPAGSQPSTNHLNEKATTCGFSAAILLVEDYADSAFYVKLVLEKCGHRVTVLDTAAGAIEAAHKESFDVIFMDLLLPDGSGLDAAKHIRDEARASGRPRVPIIALTAHALQGYRDLSYHSEMDDYLTKPIRPEALLSAVAMWAKSSQPSSSIASPVRVPGDLADLVSGFLERAETKVLQVDPLLLNDSYDEIVRIGHNLAGSGASYGFDEVSRLGRAIEAAARARESDSVSAAARELIGYLRDIKWQPES